METTDTVITNLYQKIKEREHRPPMAFNDFISFIAQKPELVIRNIFQRLYDMIKGYVGEPVDEYPDDPESINYAYYDCSRLFIDGTDHPFFADRLFANRLINNFSSFRYGIQQNRIYIFEGPHGCGKSTFLNNLLMKFEQYTRSDEGSCFETLWRLDKRALGMFPEHETHAILSQLRQLADNTPLAQGRAQKDHAAGILPGKEYLEVSCPSHDNPLLLIPKAYRKEVFDDIIKDEDFKKKLFTQKQYEWVFGNNPCTICTSLYQALLDIAGSPDKVFDMVYARRYEFNRRLGQGISVFNPGDEIIKTNVVTNQLLQGQLNTLLRDSNRVNYIFSRYASTNNGIYALMDVKANNKARLENLHGIISEGVHKVEEIEEDVNSLFLALMNPEDHENIGGTQSFTDRITYIKIPYILDYNTEARIYGYIFGEQIEKKFLPRVLHSFAKAIISSRLKTESEGLIEWINDPSKYQLYCDQNLHLLKMDIYTGLIPSWLKPEDRKRFTAKRRKAIIAESETEGDRGFSGRDSIKIFNEFFSIYKKSGKLINMAMMVSYFRERRKDLVILIPDGFIGSLVNSYNYTVLQEVKESLYYYNEDRISRDIQNYLFAANFEAGRTEKCIYTGENLEITEEFFKAIEYLILGTHVNEAQRTAFRKEVQNQYASRTLTQEIMVEGKTIKETSIYKSLLERYIHNLKEKVMDPFLENDNFRNAIKDYATESFKSYDKRIREEVSFLIKNLKIKYGYTDQGAKEICIYVIDNNLAKTFAVP
jgi:predicted Ser/Thr protein kinase